MDVKFKTTRRIGGPSTRRQVDMFWIQSSDKTLTVLVKRTGWLGHTWYAPKYEVVYTLVGEDDRKRMHLNGTGRSRREAFENVRKGIAYAIAERLRG